MVGTINKVILIGNLGRDPEVRHTQSGSKVATINIATSERWRDQSGNDQEKTEWHRIVVWGKLADIVEKYLKTGSKIYIEGRIQTRKWTDNNNIERYSTEIIASNMIMLDGRNSGNTLNTISENSKPHHAAESSSFHENSEVILDDEIPF